METGSLNLSANVIIQELSENEDLKKVIFNIAGNDSYLKLELYQTVFQILCSKKPEDIQSKYSSGKFIGYVIRIAEKQFNQKKNGFEKNIKAPLLYQDLDTIDEIISSDDIDEKTEQLEDLKEEINRMSCCPRTHAEAIASTLLNSYLRNNCNVTATAKEFKISKDYVRLRITEIKERLKQDLLEKSKNRNK